MQVKHLGEKCMGKYVLMLVVLILGFFFQRVTLLTCFVHGLQKQTIQDAPYEFNIRLNIDFIII